VGGDVSSAQRICLIGFGEVGQRLAADLRSGGELNLSAWDVLFADPGSAPSRALHGAEVRVGGNAADALAGANIVISAVTAAECVAAARSASASLAPGVLYLDLNSVSPRTKADAALAINVAGGRYVEAAVMSPIAPKGIASPILIGGPHAQAFLPVGRQLGFAGAEVFSEVIGRASAAKMCRSVMIKGIEALLTESLLAARRYGVESAVLASLGDLLPVADWPTRSRYMISRSLQHGRRRAAEMREVAVTVREAGIEPWMSAACAARQDWAAAYADAMRGDSLEAVLDAILASLPDRPGATTC
jgi:3-hydroxyisobutyrate dehydrogenase-like beta-hydroxyacid dehydrogenase